MSFFLDFNTSLTASDSWPGDRPRQYEFFLCRISFWAFSMATLGFTLGIFDEEFHLIFVL